MTRLIVKVLAVVVSLFTALVAIAFGISRTETGAKYAPEPLKNAARSAEDKLTMGYFAALSIAKLFTSEAVRNIVKSEYERNLNHH